MELLRLQVLQEEAVAPRVLDVRPKSTADQDGADDGLSGEREAESVAERPSPPTGPVTRCSHDLAASP